MGLYLARPGECKLELVNGVDGVCGIGLEVVGISGNVPS